MFRDEQDLQELLDVESLLPNAKKANKDSKLKRLTKENKALKQRIAKLNEIVLSDKGLKQMKAEYNTCFTECK